MLQKSFTTINLRLRNASGTTINGSVVVRDGLALITFSEPNLARLLYAMESKKGEDVLFNDTHNALVKRYAGKKKDEIIELIKQELTQSGGQITA